MIKRSAVLSVAMGFLYTFSVTMAQTCPVVIWDVDIKPVATRGRPLTYKVEVTNAGSEANRIPRGLSGKCLRWPWARHRS
jgi:hypothetical protein